MSKDPVCGMNVADDSPYKSHYAGHDYVFCSDTCKDKFDRTPDVFASPVGAASSMRSGENDR